MTPLLPVLAFAFVGLVFVWPLAFFGYRFYLDLIAAETAKHEGPGPGH